MEKNGLRSREEEQIEGECDGEGGENGNPRLGKVRRG